MAHNCHSNSKLLTAQTKIFTAITNNSQHKPKCSQRESRNSQRKQMTHSTNQNVHSKRKKGKPDLRPKDPWISRTLKTKRSSPFQNKNLPNANGVIFEIFVWSSKFRNISSLLQNNQTSDNSGSSQNGITSKLRRKT